MRYDDERDNQQSSYDDQESYNHEEWEPSSFTIADDDHEWTVTDSSQLNDDGYYDAHEQSQHFEEQSWEEYEFNASSSVGQETYEYFSQEEEYEYSLLNEQEFQESSQSDYDQDYDYFNDEAIWDNLQDEDYSEEFSDDELFSNENETTTDSIDSYHDDDYDHFDLDGYDTTILESFDDLDQTEDDYIHDFEQSHQSQLDDDFNLHLLYESESQKIQKLKSELMQQDEFERDNIKFKAIEERETDLQTDWDRQENIIARRKKEKVGSRFKRKNGYDHFKDQKKYSIFDHIPELKWYKHDLRGKLQSSSVKRFDSTSTRTNFVLKKGFRFKPKDRQLLSHSKSLIVNTFRVSQIGFKTISNIIKIPVRFGLSIYNKQQIRNNQLRAEKQFYETMKKNNPSIQLSGKIFHKLETKKGVSHAEISENLISQILTKYHEGLSNQEISAELKLSKNEVSVILEIYYSELLLQANGKSQEDVSKSESSQKGNAKEENYQEGQNSVIDQIIELSDQNVRPEEIARLLGLDWRFVKDTINHMREQAGQIGEPKQKNRDWTEKEVDYLLSNYGEMTPLEIGGKLGRTRRAVTTKKNALQQKARVDASKAKNVLANVDLNTLVIYSSPLQEEIIRYHIVNLHGLKSIGKIINRDARSFKNLFYDVGIDILHPGSLWKKVKEHFEGKYDVEMTKIMNDIIVGTLLGDGSMRIQTKSTPHKNQPLTREYEEILDKINSIRESYETNGSLTYSDIKYWNYAINKFKNLNTATFRLHKSIFEREWVKILVDEMVKFLPLTPYIKKIKDVEGADKIKWTCGFDTQASFQFLKIWENWYEPNGDKFKKIVPKDFNCLSPDILLHWYIGDGSYSGRNIHLYTFGFSFEENYRLQQMLSEIGLKSKIKDRVDESGVRTHFIHLSSKKTNRETLFGYLSEAKFYSKAESIFPHKFTKEINHADSMNGIRNSHPEYFTYDQKLDWKYYYGS